MERVVPALPDDDSVRAVLNTIVDPCSRAAGAPAGLVDMGLIRELSVTPAAGRGGMHVHLVIGVTEYACLLGPAFVSEARKKLLAMGGIGDVVIDLDDKFDWDPQDMSAAYQAHLRERRQAGNAFFQTIRRRADAAAGSHHDS